MDRGTILIADMQRIAGTPVLEFGFSKWGQGPSPLTRTNAQEIVSPGLILLQNMADRPL